MSKIACLEYQTTIHEIFNETLMNRELHICNENVDGFEEFLKKRLDYFAKWKSAMVGNGNNNFIAPETWINLRMTVCGFIEYARQVVTKFPHIYVPMLHSNTSVLEAMFSAMRSLGGRNANNYISRFGCLNIINAKKAIDKSKSYTSID